MTSTDAILYEYLMTFVGTHYKWGGATTLEGLDCSGLAVEFLQAAGEMSEYSDATAHSLWTKYKDWPVPLCSFGALVFFGNSRKARHVAICLNEHLMIEAGGGDSNVTDRDEAASRGALVRIRPIHKGRDKVLGVTMPPYFWRR